MSRGDKKSERYQPQQTGYDRINRIETTDTLCLIIFCVGELIVGKFACGRIHWLPSRLGGTSLNQLYKSNRKV